MISYFHCFLAHFSKQHWKQNLQKLQTNKSYISLTNFFIFGLFMQYSLRKLANSEGLYGSQEVFLRYICLIPYLLQYTATKISFLLKICFFCFFFLTVDLPYNWIFKTFLRCWKGKTLPDAFIGHYSLYLSAMLKFYNFLKSFLDSKWLQ